MNTAQNAQAWLSSVRTNRGMLVRKDNAIEHITALLAEREALLLRVEQLLFVAKNNERPSTLLMRNAEKAIQLCEALK